MQKWHISHCSIINIIVYNEQHQILIYDNTCIFRIAIQLIFYSAHHSVNLIPSQAEMNYWFSVIISGEGHAGISVYKQEFCHQLLLRLIKQIQCFYQILSGRYETFSPQLKVNDLTITYMFADSIKDCLSVCQTPQDQISESVLYLDTQCQCAHVILSLLYSSWCHIPP